MEKREIPFSPPDITDLEIAEVIRTLKSGWITTGPRTKEFERKIAAYCGTKRAAALNSATACMEAVLRFLGVGEGDEVITSAYTYTASASPVCHVGARLVLVDVARGSYEMDYDALEQAVTEKTKVIIPVDLGGVVCDYQRIFEIVERKRTLFRPENEIQEAIGRVVVAADSAHAFGSKRKINGEWEMCGNIADFTSFSFHAVKNLTTAEGGAITWRTIDGVDDDWIYREFMLMSLHGQSKDALAKTKLGAWEYDIVEPAYKWNMTDIMAAIGLRQMQRYPEILAKRKRIIRWYDSALRPLGAKVLEHSENGQVSCGHLYLIRIPGISEKIRNRMISELAGQGVASNVHYKPLPMMTAYKKMGFDIKDYPNAFRQYENEITLPLHTCLKNEDVEYVVRMVAKVLRECENMSYAV